MLYLGRWKISSRKPLLELMEYQPCWRTFLDSSPILESKQCMLNGYCMIHKQTLASKTLPDLLANVVQDVIRSLNFIKNSASSRSYEMTWTPRAILYSSTEACLSGGNSVQHVFLLRHEIQQFFPAHRKNSSQLSSENKSASSALDILNKLNAFCQRKIKTTRSIVVTKWKAS